MGAPKPFSRVITSVAPHGILTLGWSFVISSRAYFNSECKWLVAPAMMVLPFVSDIMRWTGCESCASDNMVKIMKTGCNIGLIPGGFQEATLYRRGEHNVYLKKRKGFIKYALKYGYSIQPVYVFGEELTFWTVQWLPTKIAFWLNSYNIPTYLFMGRFFFMPDYDMDFTCVVGKTIKLPQLDSPSKEEVDKYHAIFLKAYEDLFERNKEKYAARITAENSNSSKEAITLNIH
eukprot:NODE_2646_length_888_cov_145.514899_g2178_i0.p1 GENE.NODE_2646_length_888_cov_145.514899_g2178_i0~~NODE_2646_length_888_cov_145.514899_g2178_i0.p1  ORF type:complete len:241 (+),score=9.23 NODE_2646_length_888_cov_145.514899_g2178_i0:26-724(+)